MELKKSPKADLENKKNIFLEIGLMVALGVVLLAFEWKVSIEEPSDFITVSEIPSDIDLTPITVMTQPLPPPPPAIPKPIELLEIVDELEPTAEDVELIDATEDSPNSNLNLNNLDYGDEEINDEVIPFLPSEDMPVFPGNVQKWIAKNVKYPDLAAYNDIQGKVLVQFVVERDGSVSNIKVVRSVDPTLDKEAIRVISQMPKWKPGKQRGKAVRVSYTLPIAFKLGH